MTQSSYTSRYNRQAFCQEAGGLLSVVATCDNLEVAREKLQRRVAIIYHDMFRDQPSPPAGELIRVRDCYFALIGILKKRSDTRTGFSVAQAMWDLATGKPREDLTPAFFAELTQWVMGLEGRATFQYIRLSPAKHVVHGREAALVRSEEMDRLWSEVESSLSRYASGLTPEAQTRRQARKQKILQVLGGSESDWQSWNWQTRNRIVDPDVLGRIVPLSDQERKTIARARQGRLPFAITPYYASLMDDDDAGKDRDRAIRAQVIPPQDYVDKMLINRDRRGHSCDFMLESDTSPIDLITRRYPAIVILKPYNACPQICVYCQRNWEISEAMDPGALASDEQIEAAMQWIEQHPAICEVLVTGGDPLVLSDARLERIMSRLARIDHVSVIRIGTRTPVTVPMRITENLASMLGSFRELGKRDVAVVTHIEHSYELTMDTAVAVDRLRREGIGVYNQHVYTFYVSRRFEAAQLRTQLRQIGVDPYYTFAPKGKEETASYRVPLARMLQEQKEEARLMPGLRRTDEAVYNVPGLGKNYLRAVQHRDLLTVMPNGSRVYEFHPWEKNVVEQETYLSTDVPILDYLERLADAGEDPEDYDSIWYYF